MSRGTPSHHRQMVKLLERRRDLLTGLIAEPSRSVASRQGLRAEREALAWAIEQLWVVVEIERSVVRVTKHRPHSP